MLKDYKEARAYLEQVSKTGSILGLTSIRNLMGELGNVQEGLPVIHIAGTNGKGSTGAFLSEILQEAGYSVGRYTSPAVFSPLEVWQINGEPITENDYVKMVNKVKNACDAMVEKGMEHPTIFEVETAMAFCYFAEKKCDYVLLEVGMGGREDATNLIQKTVCSVLTSISRDHMQFLGESLEEIAKVKAGIIKKGCPVVSIRQPQEAMQVVEEEAAMQEAPLTIAEPEKAILQSQTTEGLFFFYEELGEVHLKLAGSYQLKNAVLAIETAKKLLSEKTESIRKNEIIKRGLEKAAWRGRFECIRKEPEIYIDGAHNEDAALFLKDTIEKCFTNRRIIYIIGVLADKEHEKMLQIMLPLADSVYTVTPQNPRALCGEQLAEEAARYHSHVQAKKTVKEAVQSAVAECKEKDVIVAFGSLSYLKELEAAVADLK
ncbi:MAG: bifunctional folylpolyglutamate synthase/dihydrofolate synthase [Roseburia sp.]